MTQSKLTFLQSGPPRGARGKFPYQGHRTMAEVIEEEARFDEIRRQRWGKAA